jgi:hypothetical protein
MRQRGEGKIAQAAGWVAALGLVLGMPTVGRADLAFQLGNNPQPGDQNVQFDAGLTGMTVTGHTNQTNTLVNFTSTQTLNTPNSGQSRVIAVNASGTQVALNTITGSVPNFTFTDLIFNPFLNQGTGPGTGGSATVTVNALSAANAPEVGMFTYNLGNGNNFLTMLATNGEKITSVNITAAGGFTDLEQVRISGLAVVPEPSTLAMVCVTGLFGLGYAWRRRRAIA